MGIDFSAAMQKSKPQLNEDFMYGPNKESFIEGSRKVVVKNALTAVNAKLQKEFCTL
jgi:hypothetical protein